MSKTTTEVIKDAVQSKSEQINEVFYGTIKIIIKQGKVVLFKIEEQYKTDG